MLKKSKKYIVFFTMVFMFSTALFYKIDPADALTSAWIDEEELGRICVEHIVPGEIKDETDEIKTGKLEVEKEDTGNKDEPVKKDVKKKKTAKGKPLVIIYHTHASESYMPYKESNYHRTDVKGTVRDVGNVLEEELEAKGINVIHDRTLHDRPSYNESYDRSLETVTALQRKYPTAKYIIDLHRDAAPASSTEGKWLEINGKRVAKFSMVVGQANQNYVELYDFAKKVRDTAEEMYEGVGGAIIEQNYNYNEFVSNNCILLEVGNNKNTIEESRKCAEYFADVLEKIINEEK